MRYLTKIVGMLLFISITYANAQIVAPPGQKAVSLLEAIQSTLLNHPVLRSQEAQVEISRGLREQASGLFDRSIQGGLLQSRDTTPLTTQQKGEYLLAGHTVSDQTTNITTYEIGTSQLFRNGISIKPGFQVSRYTDNLFSGSGINSSDMALVVTVPLLRGRGRKAVAAQETAAKIDVDATALDLDYLISQLMASTATSYWSVVAAKRNLAIAYEAEERGRQYLDNVQALVAGDHVPRNDLNEVAANLAQRSSNRIAVEQQLIAAQEQLAFNMGLDADRIVKEVPTPADDFPNGEAQQLPSDSPAAIEYYITEALRRRADYLASGRRTAEEGVLLAAAQNRLLPQINLNFGGGFAGMQQGRRIDNFLASSAAGVQGPNATVGVSYVFPGSNQAARGALRQSDALSKQAQYRLNDLERSIGASVITATHGVRNAILRLEKTRQSVSSFTAALQGEREKYKGGIGSIVDILTVEDRLTTALSDEVQAKLGYALALTQFRFVTGTLAQPNAGAQNIQADTLITLPFLRAPQERQ